MRRIISSIVTVTLMLSVVAGLTGCNSLRSAAMKDWYKETLEYYKENIGNSGASEKSELVVPDDLLDKNNEAGYLLYDLDGDGIDELLIGLIDDEPYTKFTNVVVLHSTLGPYCLLSGTADSPIYLCADGIIRIGDDCLKYDSADSEFKVVASNGAYLPQQWELTPF